MREKKLTSKQIAEYEMLLTQLEHAYNELKDLSKKTPSEELNTLKIKVVNRMLERIQSLLTDEPTIAFLDVLSESDHLPIVSDAVLIIGQYIAALELFKGKYSDNYGDWIEY